MLPGPTYVYKCPGCGNLISRGSLASGNTFGAKLYSDGKRIAPHLPDFPDLTKCGKCNAIMWLSKIEEIGTYDREKEESRDWGNEDRADFLGVDDLFRALELGVFETRNEELYVRQLLWWSFNDRIRDGGEIFAKKNEEERWRLNCQKMLGLLDPTDIHQKIMIAEIFRNLGDFESCLNIVNSIDNEDFRWVAEILSEQCVKKKKRVVMIN